MARQAVHHKIMRSRFEKVSAAASAVVQTLENAAVTELPDAVGAAVQATATQSTDPLKTELTALEARLLAALPSLVESVVTAKLKGKRK